MKVAAVEELARQGRLYPSLIIHGGTIESRRHTVLRLARTLLCEQRPEERPCESCRHCSRVVWPSDSAGAFHPDFRLLTRDLKTSTSVEATKSFLQLAHMAPFEARGQVFVIADAESLTPEAANSLLKTLEEPHSRTPRNFLLLTPSQHDLLPTIRSRSAFLFLGGDLGIDEEQVAELAARFAENIGRFVESGSSLHLVLAAGELADAGSWQDARSALPWTTAAAAVKQSCDLVSGGDRRRMLALAEDLLNGWTLRLRGIQPQRILEGMVVRHLAR